MELVTLALDDERRAMVARLCGMDTDDPALRLMVLKAIDYIEAQLVAGPTWIEETPEAEPVVKGALDPIAVIRNGVQETISGEELAQMVNRASDNAPMWVPDEFVDYRETDSPWSSWLEGEENRAYRSPYADDAAWPKSVTCKMWAERVAAWKNVGDADQVFAAMVGGECELSEDEQRVLVLLENLADALSEETDGSARTVASALANKVHALGVRVKAEDDQTPQEALRDTFAWFLGAEVGGWEYELPTADGLRRSVEEWVGRACNAKGV